MISLYSRVFSFFFIDIPANVEASDWILGNVQVLGYYRMNYDLDNWNKLIGQLKANHEVKYFTFKILLTYSKTNKMH